LSQASHKRTLRTTPAILRGTKAETPFAAWLAPEEQPRSLTAQTPSLSKSNQRPNGPDSA